MAQSRPAGAIRASIVDVAERAGVSVATVSRALRNMPNVSQATRDKVLAAANELQYTASPLASGLVTGRIRAVGVVMPYAGRWFFAETLRGIEAALREAGYDLVLHVLADEERRTAFFESLPVRRRVDAVIVVGLALDGREVELLHRLDLPLAGVSEVNAGVDTQLIDNVAAARLATEHLLELGHRRIACIGGDAGDVGVAALRTQGYRRALAAAGITPVPELEVVGGFTAAGGEEAMTGLLEGPVEQRPTAVMCHSDEMAFGALRALRRAGLRCPQDVSVVGIDGHELAAAFDVTTVAQPVLEQGAAAVRTILAALDPDAGPAGTGTAHVHPVQLVRRDSTGPVPEPRP